ncbi:hypothetical protein QWI17_17040 [Gilvimarinus sp. SDUM040013]|uniref:FG-GAP repeat protein n=1 Tax=Gilvimarinus gilvus TaxID=3058038 RepID=A0ABU4RZ64_9GAMM|nr:hypothetical protein [Gilvimarinus sp. SDUM040013]MDO3387551.1 hypothetical protein [Gilvimarinus sp. SDUM040013]MDX6850184.1 hypothetical protein [Gilvimarinus sp. SDUM040013]
MTRITFYLLLPFLIAAATKAWWVNYRYEPTSDATIYGNDFSAVELYTCANNKYFTAEQCHEIAKNNGVFTVLRDLNNDGVKDLWSVGVAKYKSGESPYANVVVVSNPITKKIQQILAVELKEPGFALFFGSEERLSLFFCMKCGSYADIVWQDNEWTLVWPELYGSRP